MLVAFIQRAVVQGIPLLFGSTGEILTEKSGNLNLGTAGVMYVGGITGVIGAFLYEQNAAQMSTFLTILIPILSSMFGSLVMGLIYSFLTVTLRANQNVTGLALTTFGVGFGNFFGGSLIKLTNSDVPSVTLTATSLAFKKSLPFADKLGWFGDIFLSYSFLAYVAIAIALIVSFYFSRTRSGLNLRAVGENPATADAAGRNGSKYKIRSHFEKLLVAHAEVRYIVVNNEKSAEKDGAENADVRLPNSEDNQRDGEPASVAKAVVGPNAAGVVHNVVKTAETCDHAADACSAVLVPSNVYAGSIRSSRIFTDSAQVKAEARVVKDI